MEWLGATMERARERFAMAGEYPLIDDQELIRNDVVYSAWPWSGEIAAHRREDELLQAALTSDHTDPPTRFVYLNLFFRWLITRRTRSLLSGKRRTMLLSTGSGFSVI